MLAGGGPVAVADHQTVAVFDVGNGVIEGLAVFSNGVQRGIRAGSAVVVRLRGVALPIAVEADGQLALGIVFAEDDLCNGCAALLAGIPGEQQRGNLVEPRLRFHAAAAGKGDDGVRIGRGDGVNQGILSPGQREGAIVSFALCDPVKARCHDDDIGKRGKLSRVGRDQLRLIDDA